LPLDEQLALDAKYGSTPKDAPLGSEDGVGGDGVAADTAPLIDARTEESNVITQRKRAFQMRPTSDVTFDLDGMDGDVPSPTTSLVLILKSWEEQLRWTRPGFASCLPSFFSSLLFSLVLRLVRSFRVEMF
jgi:hypothetical protein